MEEKLREEESVKAEHRKSTTWSLRSVDDAFEVSGEGQRNGDRELKRKGGSYPLMLVRKRERKSNKEKGD